MQLKQLKSVVYEIWQLIHKANRAVVQTEQFKPEMKTYGDLRRKATWEKALAVLWANAMFDTNSDNYTLVSVMLNPKPGGWEYEYRHQIFEQLLAIPGAIECIKNGLEQVYNYHDNPSDAEEECRAIFELVQGATATAVRAGAAELRLGVQRQLTKTSQARTH